MKENKIAHITSVHPRFDTRIFLKEVRSLSEDKRNVCLIVADGKGDEVSNGINIYDVGKPNNRVSRLLFSWIKITYTVLKRRIKVIHFHDPELISAALLLRLFGVKVIMDIHELVIHDIDDKDWLRKFFLTKIVKFIYSIFERIGIFISYKVILAEAGYTNYFHNKYKSQLSKFSVVRNVPKMELIDSKPKLKRDGNKNILIYVGLISKIRGIAEMLETIAILDDTFELWLIGRWDSEKLHSKCKLHAAWSKVKYFGFLPPQEIYSICKSGDIGLSTLHPVENHLYTTPVKSFEYMACKLPMLMSDFPYWKEYYLDKAYYVNPLAPKDIAGTIVSILENTKYKNELIEKAYHFAFQNSWEKEKEILLKQYKEII
ncbi:glycosyltransferase [Marivirga harenae]|uniref:glycosyltransferase n=1 Tax=Marivirga harenae TaxID=2010992 RepID=UPI0026DEF931|nr:glycosyltransferase [Marivirga harenae]WKV13129.1 glycosyltransferase [Marivirga harenae]